MKKQLIVRIAEGLGNQLFMYSNAYALSKENNFDLFIDNKSGFFKNKDIRNYELNNFNISSQICSNQFKYSSYKSDLKRKLMLQIDKFKKNKSFLIEKKDSTKKTKFYNLINDFKLNDSFIVEGHFESEKYFINYQKELQSEFSLIDETKYKNNQYYNSVNQDNIISICIRKNRFSERIKPNNLQKNKSNLFIRDTIAYIKKAECFIETKIINPIYYVWSDDFSGLREFFPENKYNFIDNKNNKTLNDFFLMTQCKNFIVGPTTFHWWGAWLSKKENKICVRPKDLNPSNNSDFWPNSWVSI